jgi:hypothetical protein
MHLFLNAGGLRFKKVNEQRALRAESEEHNTFQLPTSGSRDITSNATFAEQLTSQRQQAGVEEPFCIHSLYYLLGIRNKSSKNNGWDWSRLLHL